MSGVGPHVTFTLYVVPGGPLDGVMSSPLTAPAARAPNTTTATSPPAVAHRRRRFDRVAPASCSDMGPPDGRLVRTLSVDVRQGRQVPDDGRVRSRSPWHPSPRAALRGSTATRCRPRSAD